MAIYRVSCVGLQGHRAIALKQLARRAVRTLRSQPAGHVLNDNSIREEVSQELRAVVGQWRENSGRDGVVLWSELCDPYDLGAFLQMELTTVLKPRITVDAGAVLYVLSRRKMVNAEHAIRRQLRRRHWSRMYLNWILQMLLHAVAETKQLRDTTIAVSLDPLGPTRHEAYRTARKANSKGTSHIPRGARRP